MTDEEATTSYTFTGRLAHVDRGGKAMCRQSGMSLRLCSEQEFTKLAGIEKCGRCERSLGGDEYGRIVSLGSQQQRCLREIKSAAGKDGWCAVAGLCQKKTSAGWTSLHRSIKALVEIGLVEKRTDKHHRALVRLTEKIRGVPQRFLFGRAAGRILDAARPEREA